MEALTLPEELSGQRERLKQLKNRGLRQRRCASRRRPVRTSARGPLPKTGKDTSWKATVTKIGCLRRGRSPRPLQCLFAAAPRWRPRLRGGRRGGRVGTLGGLLLYFSPGTKVTNEGTPERGSCHPSSSLHARHMWRRRVAVEVSSPYSPCFFLSFSLPLSSLCYTHRAPPRPASRHAVPHSRMAWRLLRHDHHRGAAPPSRRLPHRCMYSIWQV